MNGAAPPGGAAGSEPAGARPAGPESAGPDPAGPDPAGAGPTPAPADAPPPPTTSGWPGWWPDRRLGLIAVVAAAVLLAGVAVAGVAGLAGGTSPAGAWRLPAPAGSAAPAPPASGPGGGGTITLSATGDIILGAAPDALPPDHGRTFFAAVRAALQADLPMGNLEQPLTNDTGVDKCAGSSPSPGQRQTCFAFRSPPEYASVLSGAGFRLLNLANNHAYDFGPEGNRQTRAALDHAGLAYTGAPGQITVVGVKGIRVAVLGFSSYAWSQSVVDIEAAKALVRRAAAGADLVVVQMHVGAEGADRTHVRPGTEMFLGENRGDPIRFARAVVDAGADLVIGHGPHVMRAMEFYRGRLIAYSLGNFAGYRSLSYAGVVGIGGVLRVSLRPDGGWAGGRLVATRMVAPGLPALDPSGQALALVRSLSTADLPGSGVRIGPDGALTPP